MGNRPSGQQPRRERPEMPRIARGEAVDVLRNNKWHTGKITKVDSNGAVTVTFTMYNIKKEVVVQRREYLKKLAMPGSKTDDVEEGAEDRKSVNRRSSRKSIKAAIPLKRNSQRKSGVDLAQAVSPTPGEETSSVPEATLIDKDSASDGQPVDYVDVLDKSQDLSPFDPFQQISMPDTDIPPAPEHGWLWRPAVIESTKGNIATVRFLDLDTVAAIYPDTAKVNLKDEKSVAPYQSKSAVGVRHHNFQVGDPVDIEDHFRKKGTLKVGKKWRKCQVVVTTPYHIRVTFVGWSKAFDEWFHVLQQADRIAEFGTHTETLLRKKEEREENFVKNLRLKKGLTVVHVEPDGNCLFRAVAHQVYGDVERHDIVRSDCMDYIEKNRDRFEVLLESGQFDAYVEHKRKPRVWGDDAEVRAMEELYDRPVQIFAVTGDGSNTEPLKIHFDGDLPDDKTMGPYEPIRLSFHGENHYNSVIPYRFEVEKAKDGSKIEKDVSREHYKPPPMRLKGVIRKFRRVRSKSYRKSASGFRLDTHDIDTGDDDESKFE